jgi:hypothetical protein
MKTENKSLRILLWILATVLMVSAVLYQRTTGPTYPKRGSIEVAGQEWEYRLARTCESIQDARIVLPTPSTGVQATLQWRRYPTSEEFKAVPLAWVADEYVKGGDPGAMVAELPRQPAAGKLEYYLDVQVGEKSLRIPALQPATGAEEVKEGEEENILIRYKDPVPGTVLWPHVILMFLSLLFGARAALAAIAAPSNMRRIAWCTLGGMTLGGMVFGPFVQKYAFGHYWTGFPNGTDLTDNKMLIMWISWVVACGVIGTKPKPKEGIGRLTVIIASLVMTGVYLIPHSMRGSELDYSQVDRGVDPTAAVGTSED